MKFKYTRYSKTVLRPMVTAELCSGAYTVTYDLLVDSGADINVVSADLAELLGLDLKSGVVATVVGPTGAPQSVYIHPIKLKIGRHTIKTRAAFMDIDNPFGLAGQRGVFDAFRITFDLQGKEFELKPYTTTSSKS